MIFTDYIRQEGSGIPDEVQVSQTKLWEGEKEVMIRSAIIHTKFIYRRLAPCRLISYLFITIIMVFLSLFLQTQARGKVTGRCANCHTMHNSQDGTAVVPDGPYEYLLTETCVGCHSHSGSETIVEGGGSRIPIVYNYSLGSPPDKPLAGGNFYWVKYNGDAYGHNVRGISTKDDILSWAPGSVGCANSCHESLTYADANTHNNMKNGCQGCHQNLRHHGIGVHGEIVTEDEGYYRFLSAPSSHESLGGAVVNGIEDANWEQDANKSNHNTYYCGDGSENESPQSIGKFCAGCHYNYHSPGFASTNYVVDNRSGPWLRHPADAALPSTGEYADYTEYDPIVPVGRPDLSDFTIDEVRPGTDTVICISCHRAHGSPYPDMLRWNYNTMKVGGGGSGGCFNCHSAKSD